MTALIIIGILLLVILVVLFLPVSLDFKYENEFFLKMKIAGIKVYSVEPQQDINKPDSPDTESDAQAEQQEKNLFDKLKDKHGFTGAVKEMFNFASAIFHKMRECLKHVCFKRFFLDITVATDNAAKTAIEYGSLCSVAYPVLTYIKSVVNVKLKKVNINSDFNNSEPDFKVSFVAEIKLIFALLAVKTIFMEYNNFKSRNEL